MAIWAIQSIGISRSLDMRGSTNHIAQALLVEIPQFEQHITKLYRTVRAYPNHVIGGTRHPHVLFLDQPIRYRSQTLKAMLDPRRIGPLQLDQSFSYFLNVSPVFVFGGCSG